MTMGGGTQEQWHWARMCLGLGPLWEAGGTFWGPSTRAVERAWWSSQLPPSSARTRPLPVHQSIKPFHVLPWELGGGSSKTSHSCSMVPLSSCALP